MSLLPSRPETLSWRLLILSRTQLHGSWGVRTRTRASGRRARATRPGRAGAGGTGRGRRAGAGAAAPPGRRGASAVEQGLGGRATRPERARVRGQRQAPQLRQTGCAAEQGRVKWGPQIHVLPSFLQGK